MILAYSHVIYLIANIFRVFSINLFLETIFSKDNLRCSQELKRTIFILYYLFNSIIYLHYRIPIITVFSNMCLFFFLTLPYYSTMCKRIFAVFCIFLLGILCETIVSRSSILILGHIPSIEVITYTISNFLFYIVVILTKSILGQEERIYQKGRWAVLIMIPSITITCVCLVSSIILQDVTSMPGYMKTSFCSVFGALIAMASLVALSNLMKTSGMLSVIATVIANLLGPVYPAIAVIIGSLGSFVAGTTTGSNILFAPMHYEACTILGFNIPLVFAAQSAGGALGNMICTNNVVAVCATVGFKGEEGTIMRKVFKPICILWLLYCLLALLYAYVLFPVA